MPSYRTRQRNTPRSVPGRSRQVAVVLLAAVELTVHVKAWIGLRRCRRTAAAMSTASKESSKIGRGPRGTRSFSVLPPGSQRQIRACRGCGRQASGRKKTELQDILPAKLTSSSRRIIRSTPSRGRTGEATATWSPSKSRDSRTWASSSRRRRRDRKEAARGCKRR
ncbi:hypothetical protein Cni_G09741 [Canna indica]|uniref:Uncharacterized protein n=1 Tax=Canna indica TaxID=4628 RepID=A0AAQ3K5A9_9LILI|nr:hypothetical protein Cni_G09741 [Canna indica]